MSAAANISRRCRNAGGQLRDFRGYRAGDKGDTADVALSLTTTPGYELIVREVTAAHVQQHFGSMVHGEAIRYEAANVRALNFVFRGPGRWRAQIVALRQPRQVPRRSAGPHGDRESMTRPPRA